MVHMATIAWRAYLELTLFENVEIATDLYWYTIMPQVDFWKKKVSKLRKSKLFKFQSLLMVSPRLLARKSHSAAKGFIESARKGLPSKP